MGCDGCVRCWCVLGSVACACDAEEGACAGRRLSGPMHKCKALTCCANLASPVPKPTYRHPRTCSEGHQRHCSNQRSDPCMDRCLPRHHAPRPQLCHTGFQNVDWRALCERRRQQCALSSSSRLWHRRTGSFLPVPRSTVPLSGFPIRGTQMVTKNVRSVDRVRKPGFVVAATWLRQTGISAIGQNT